MASSRGLSTMYAPSKLPQIFLDESVSYISEVDTIHVDIFGIILRFLQSCLRCKIWSAVGRTWQKWHWVYSSLITLISSHFFQATCKWYTHFQEIEDTNARQFVQFVSSSFLCVWLITQFAYPLVPSIYPGYQGSGEQGNGGCIAPLPFKRGATGAEVPFYNYIIGHFMVYQNRIETNLLQLFAHPENAQGFYMIPVIIFEVNIVAKLKHA